mmetsp:Transcript_19403/g.60879  ORF Transcript_19403/g.60879 Transcript_19403/m.60879 type:complete len:233 (+) Transcript_19403:503-1201(+)
MPLRVDQENLAARKAQILRQARPGPQLDLPRPRLHVHPAALEYLPAHGGKLRVVPANTRHVSEVRELPQQVLAVALRDLRAQLLRAVENVNRGGTPVPLTDGSLHHRHVLQPCSQRLHRLRVLRHRLHRHAADELRPPLVARVQEPVYTVMPVLLSAGQVLHEGRVVTEADLHEVHAAAAKVGEASAVWNRTAGLRLRLRLLRFGLWTPHGRRSTPGLAAASNIIAMTGGRP